MKPLLVAIVAASFAVACSQAAPRNASDGGQEAASTPAQQSAPPATTPPAAAASATQPAPAAAPPAPPATTPPASQSAAAPPAAPAATSGTPAPGAAPREAAPPPAKPAAPPEPKFREVTIPAGTALSVTVLSTLGSDTSKVEDRVKGSLAEPVLVSGTTAVPAGSTISGTVIDVKEPGRVKGKALLEFRFDRLTAHGTTHKIETSRVSSEPQGTRKSDVKKGGIGAGLGAIVGGVAGGGSGAAIGAVAGGTGAVLATKGNQVRVAPGTVVSALLQEPVTVQVPIK
jgi:hypothetical protein